MDNIVKVLARLALHSRLIIAGVLISTIIITFVVVIKTLSHVPAFKTDPKPTYGPIYIDRGNADISVDADADIDINIDINIDISDTVAVEEHGYNSHLPPDFRYKVFDSDKIKLWLKNRNSMLAQDKYCNIVFDVAKSFGINPILLFSILGQEQNFVPADSKYANEIINNPFNVFGSWKDYNTDLQDSAEIASRTIITIFKSFPEGEDPYRWLNSRDGVGGYAEDTKWGEGVEFFFNKLSEVVEE